jgi:hypothetical protein
MTKRDNLKPILSVVVIKNTLKHALIIKKVYKNKRQVLDCFPHKGISRVVRITRITPSLYKKKLLLLYGKQLILENALTRRNPSLALVKHHVFLLLSWKHNRIIPFLIKRRIKYLDCCVKFTKVYNNYNSTTNNILFITLRRYSNWVIYKNDEFLLSVIFGFYLYFLIWVVLINDSSESVIDLVSDFNKISAIYFCYLW